MADQAELSRLIIQVEGALAQVRDLKLDHLDFLLSMALTEARRQQSAPSYPPLRLVTSG